MINQTFVCGYLFDFCGSETDEMYFALNTTTNYTNFILADKPTTVSANNYLDYRYELSSPEQNPATFNVLWISDV